MQKESPLSRRSFVCGAACVTAAALVGTTAATTQAHQAFAEEEARPYRGKQFGFLVKTENCMNCGLCVQACREHSGTPDDVPARRKVTSYRKEDGTERFVSTSCMHCAEPACVSVCPAQAVTKGVGGIVSVDPDRCIGCKYCYQACPFGVPHFDSDSMDKCDCCLGNGVKPGDTPYCVQACKFDALHYGLLEDFEEEIANGAVFVEAAGDPSLLLM